MGNKAIAAASISKAKEGWNMVANFFHWHHQKIIECQQETLLLAFAKLRRKHQKAIIRAEERSFQTLQSLDQLYWLKHTNESPVSRQVSFFFLNWKISSSRWKVINHMGLSKLVAKTPTKKGKPCDCNYNFIEKLCKLEDGFTFTLRAKNKKGSWRKIVLSTLNCNYNHHNCHIWTPMSTKKVQQQ